MIVSQYKILQSILEILMHYFKNDFNQIIGKVYNLNYQKKVMIAQGKLQVEIITDPIILFTQELKDKNIKKQAIQEISTIALVLGPNKIRNQLVPILIKTFVNESLELRITIIKSFVTLLQYIQHSSYAFSILEFVLDVLCVFNEEDLRKQAYNTLQKLLEFIDLRANQTELMRVIILLSKQNEKNIRELVLKLIRHLLVVANSQNETELIQILNSYKSTQDGQLLLVEQLCQFIKIMPPFPQTLIKTIIEELIHCQSSKVKSKLIHSIILLTKISDESVTRSYFTALNTDGSSEVIASVISQIKIIRQVFSSEAVSQLLTIIDKFQSHDNTVKTAILDVLQYIPLTEDRRSTLLSGNNFKSLSLSKVLANSLCKIHDIEALNYIIDNSDTEFKNKLFPKLPSTCQIHIRLMDHLLNQKNWRSKLTLLQNIEKRLQNEQNVQILIPKLLQQLGDKIAIVRASVVKVIAQIIKARSMELSSIVKQLNTSVNSKNWFERQSVLLLIDQIVPQFSSIGKQDKKIIETIVVQLLKEKIINICSIATTLAKRCGFTN